MTWWDHFAIGFVAGLLWAKIVGPLFERVFEAGVDKCFKLFDRYILGDE